MPVLSTNDAIERLATGVEKAGPAALAEIYAEIFPEVPGPESPTAADLAEVIRRGLEAEEIVDVWNVVFPDDRNVWYNEQENGFHYNEELVGYSELD